MPNTDSQGKRQQQASSLDEPAEDRSNHVLGFQQDFELMRESRFHYLRAWELLTRFAFEIKVF